MILMKHVLAVIIGSPVLCVCVFFFDQSVLCVFVSSDWIKALIVLISGVNQLTHASVFSIDLN